MNVDDRQEFNRRLRELFATVGQPLSDDRLEGFWKGLTRMSVFEFGRAVDLMLAELAQGDPPKFLNARHVWAARDRLRARVTPEVGGPRSVNEQLLALAESDPKNNGGLKEALRRNLETWREMEGRDPEAFELEVGIARCGLILAREAPDSPQYAEAVRQDQAFRERRFAVWDRRSAALAQEDAA